jgi:hypothetical protein
MEIFAKEKEAWLRGFLDLGNGILSHDTLSSVMGRIDPSASRARLPIGLGRASGG